VGVSVSGSTPKEWGGRCDTMQAQLKDTKLQLIQWVIRYCHLVENPFIRLKPNRAIATRYGKLNYDWLGFFMDAHMKRQQALGVNMAFSESKRLELKVARRISEAKDVSVLELRDPLGEYLPSFSPGAHIEIRLNNGLIRHYSLLNDSQERDRYVVAVGLCINSLGGSRYIHSNICEGDLLSVSPPRNNFPLEENAERYCFIAGGIGITPILSMIRWCILHDKTWRLFYTSRNRQRAAFYEELQVLASPQQVIFHFNDEHEGRFLEIEQIADSIAPGEHVYCCGPNPLMQCVKQAMESHPASQVHFEWFSAPVQPVLEDSGEIPTGSFDVILRESGRTVRVSEEKSILDALEAQGIEAPYSCRAGICRTCETEVCSGTPDHRDFILSDEEKSSGETILICVSRAKSSTLEINL